ncbi:MAG TPA: hypothetical protein ENJ82_12305, partial [Bacteroidetes bacterium]|nr:hypothetical protein [Bacteroidota bacterium]
MKKILLLICSIFPLFFTFALAVGGEKDVKLIHAEGKIFYHEIYVTWSTEYENIACDFIIEASENNKEWRIRGRVKSKGASKRHSEYQFVDPREESFRYYRIRKSNSRGRNDILSRFELENYSITVTMEEMTIDHEKKLVLEYTVDKDQELMVRIYNRIGEQVVTKVMPFKVAGQYVYQ